MSSSKNIYNIPAGQNFLKSLAAGVFTRFFEVDKPLKFSELQIFLPNKRSCLALKNCFLEIAAGKSFFLPQIISIGDFSEDEAPAFSSAILPAISNIKRKLVIAEIIKKWQLDYFSSQQDISNFHYTPDQAIKLASEITTLIDDLQKHGVDESALEDIVPVELAEHWQITLGLAKKIFAEWRQFLAKENKLDPVARRNLVIEAYQVEGKISIIAGTSGSNLATKNLIHRVISSPSGYCIFSAFDGSNDAGYWQAQSETSAQYQLKTLVDELGIKPEGIKSWHGEIDSKNNQEFALEVMRPAQSLEAWRNLQVLEKPCITTVTAVDNFEEAGIIALKIREFIQQNRGGRIAVITSRAGLINQVTQQIAKWQIASNNSSGLRIGETACYNFFMLCWELFEESFAPLKLAEFFKSNFCTRPENYDLFEKKFLRGNHKYNSLEHLKQLLSAEEVFAEISETLTVKFSVFSAMEHLLKSEKITLSSLLAAHINFAQTLSDNLIFQGEEGLALLEVLENLGEACLDVTELPSRFYLATIKSLVAEEKFWPKYNSAAHVNFLPPIEARLQNFDLVIIASLNDGNWPKRLSSPLLNNQMRKIAGLASFDWQMGQSAHDFYFLLAQHNIFITRAERENGQVTIASSYFTRLKTLSGKFSFEFDESAHWQKLFQLFKFEGATSQILPESNANPDISQRPKKISATKLALLINSPYEYYASAILKLKPLDEFDKTLDAAQFGSLIHKALELFAKNYLTGEYAEFIRAGQAAFAEIKNSDAEKIWWPRYVDLAGDIINFEKTRRQNNLQIFTEIKGESEIDGITLHAIADRIEIDVQNNTATICDFKTGSLPTNKAIEAGLAPQLIVEAVIFDNGGFAVQHAQSAVVKNPHNTMRAEAVEYLKLFSDAGFSKKYDDISALKNEYIDFIKRLTTHYFKSKNPFLNNQNDLGTNYQTGYEHFSRNYGA